MKVSKRPGRKPYLAAEIDLPLPPVFSFRQHFPNDEPLVCCFQTQMRMPEK